MAALLKLKDQGWHLTEEGLKKLSEDGKILETKELIKKALDIDLRDISNGGLSPDFAKGSKYEVPANGVILQIIKMCNISAPKGKEESKTAPRLLQIDFTDGRTLCTGLELDHISTLSVNTPPGTKLLLKGTIKIMQGMLILQSQQITLCGGHVTVLFDKWEVQRTLEKYANGITVNKTSGGPPPWIPFGQKNQYSLNEKSFKSLEEKEKEITKETAAFLAARNDAIAEASKLKQKKVFGGGNRQLVDHNVKKIMDKGYSEDQAKISLKYARNNLEKAMGNLKRQDDKATTDINGRPSFVKNSRDDRMGRKGKTEITESAKPSAKVSLFDFLEDKIKVPQAPASLPVITPSNNLKPQKSHSTSTFNKTDEIKKPYSKQDENHSNRVNTKSTTHTRPPYNQSNSLDDNRSKFENNISASFANRQKRDDEPHSNHEPKSKWNAGKSVGGKPNFAINESQHIQNNNNNNQPDFRYNSRDKNQNESRNAKTNYSYGSNSSNFGNYPNSGKYVKGDSETTNASEKNRASPCYEDNKNQNFHQSSHPHDRKSNQSHASPANIHQLVEATSSLKISNPKNNRHPPQHMQQHHHQHQPQQQPQQPAQPQLSQQHQQQPHQQNKNQFEKVFPQIPNGLYNPYKIMGFQNKETNEFALNVLKTQNFENTPHHGGHVQPPPPRQESYIPMQNFSTPPPPLPNPHFVPGNNIQQFNWTWNLHDICFAKYWEDGLYYNAEITGMSDKTCVVQFLEYGNFEEVLLTDCVPFNDANIQIISQYNENVAHQNMQYQQHQQHRYRGDRQMYVPPAGRSTK